MTPRHLRAARGLGWSRLSSKRWFGQCSGCLLPLAVLPAISHPGQPPPEACNAIDMHGGHSAASIDGTYCPLPSLPFVQRGNPAESAGTQCLAQQGAMEHRRPPNEASTGAPACTSQRLEGQSGNRGNHTHPSRGVHGSTRWCPAEARRTQGQPRGCASAGPPRRHQLHHPPHPQPHTRPALPAPAWHAQHHLTACKCAGMGVGREAHNEPVFLNTSIRWDTGSGDPCSCGEQGFIQSRFCVCCGHWKEVADSNSSNGGCGACMSSTFHKAWFLHNRLGSKIWSDATCMLDR